MTFTRWTYGPGIALLRVPGSDDRPDRHDARSIAATCGCCGTSTCRSRWSRAAEEIVDGVTGTYGVEADIPIWRDKVFRDRPLLVKGDGPVAEFRRWYSQFYEGN